MPPERISSLRILSQKPPEPMGKKRPTRGGRGGADGAFCFSSQRGGKGGFLKGSWRKSCVFEVRPEGKRFFLGGFLWNLKEQLLGRVESWGWVTQGKLKGTPKSMAIPLSQDTPIK